MSHDTLLLRIVRDAIQANASDVHLTTDNPPVFRINGEIVIAPHAAINERTLTQSLNDILDARQRGQWLANKRLSFSWCPPGLGVFRVSIYSHLGRMEASIRLGFKKIPSADSLGVPPLLIELARKPQGGLLLVTGPTGVGKTTTLNAVLAEIHRTDRRKIITIEDPVEFRMPPGRSLVVQQELGLDTETYRDALFHALRQDPDIICIGEMRDTETISTALTAAETGHMVLATLHTTGAAGTISRIIDAFPGERQNQVRVQLAQTLQGTMTQQLLPRADGMGRVMVYELMPMTTAVANTIRDGRLHQLENVLQTGRMNGMVRMDHMVRDVYRKGLITYEVAARAVKDISSLEAAPEPSPGDSLDR
jgi:twitching motility protein PilT